MKDGLGDWRIQAVTRLAKPMAPAYPGGPSHKVGTPVYLQTVTKDKKHNYVGFITPSATALALNISMSAAIKAERLKNTLAFKKGTSPWGKSSSVANENIPNLYDYFESCMVSVTFSFQALETYCNSIIVENLKEPFKLDRKGREKSYSPSEVERNVSTQEKLAIILPTILKVKTPKGTKIWQRFVKLKKIRDSTIHLKSQDMYNKGDVDKESLFFQFLNNDSKIFPELSLDIIQYFMKKTYFPRWMKGALEYFSRL